MFCLRRAAADACLAFDADAIYDRQVLPADASHRANLRAGTASVTEVLIGHRLSFQELRRLSVRAQRRIIRPHRVMSGDLQRRNATGSLVAADNLFFPGKFSYFLRRLSGKDAQFFFILFIGPSGADVVRKCVAGRRRCGGGHTESVVLQQKRQLHESVVIIPVSKYADRHSQRPVSLKTPVHIGEDFVWNPSGIHRRPEDQQIFLRKCAALFSLVRQSKGNLMYRKFQAFSHLLRQQADDVLRTAGGTERRRPYFFYHHILPSPFSCFPQLYLLYILLFAFFTLRLPLVTMAFPLDEAYALFPFSDTFL